ncbi:MAG: serine/threonine-protein kinase [Rivularia sp. (in: cyanobacteria)]
MNNQVLQARYQINRELSQKAGRQTFLAQDIYSQDLVIIKILQFDRDFQWNDLKLFEREANTLKNLNHPAIPKYLDYFEVDEDNIHGFALVQTYIDALSLETTIQQQRKFTEAELVELAEKLLNILIFLHEQIPPIIHRDIKPSNILLTNRSGNSIGDVYLVDFGSVQTVASKNEGTITIVGSYGYIPLEQFGGQTTMASDLYSLGMTLIYLVTGVHPAELTQVDGRVKFNSSNISSKFTKWLEKLSHPYIDKRFDSAPSALTALKSKDGSYGDCLHLKPANSKIQLYRDREKLEIIYQDLDLNDAGSKFGIGCVLNVFVIIISINIPNGFYLFFGFIIFQILFSHIYLKFLAKPYYRIVAIDLNNSIKTGISRDRELAKIKWFKQSSQTKYIDLLAYNPGYTFNRYLDETGTVIKRGTVTINAQLSIHTGQREYTVGNPKSKLLTQAELWWLGQELSDFLGLELQIIYPTPQPPAETACGGC